MGNREKMIAYAYSKWGKVGYSMTKRLGPAYLDCSSFVYYSLIAGDFLPKGSPIGTTEDLYKLKGKVFREIYSYQDVQRGDIFIRGEEGKSLGAGGHTGIFLRRGSIIHCNARGGGVTINDETTGIGYFLDRRRSKRERYFRPLGEKPNPSLIKYENRRGITRAACNVREAPSLSARVVAVYPKGATIYYDSVYQGDGYRRISYIGRSSGKRRYVAFRKISSGESWISF